jgi:gluconate 2-dehydrogenase alpha chain
VTEEFDVIIVGLGASGGIIAEQLTAAGVRVLGLEKGADYTQDDFAVKQDELRYYQRGAIVSGGTVDPVTWRADNKSVARLFPWSAGVLGSDEPLYGMPAIGVGGGTLHWAGAAYRFREADFRMRSAIAERFGESSLPEGSTVADWPITYADLEPYYEKAEWEQGYSGSAGNIKGEFAPGTNPFDPPRNRDFPMPPVQQCPGDVPWVAATERLGMHPFRQPLAMNSVEYKGRPACVNCGFCHGYPCHVAARSSTHVTSVPAAKLTGNLDLRPHSRVIQVNRTPDGKRVIGVTYLDSAGETHEVVAPIVILSAYALENARLMLVSGITGQGQVGANFMTHNFGWFASILPEATNPFLGTFNASSAIDDFTSEMVPDNDLGVLWGSPVISVTGDLQPIEAFHLMNPAVQKYGLEFKHWMRDNYTHMHRMYSQHTNFPYKRHYVDLDPFIKDSLGVPAIRITHAWEDHDANSVELFGGIKQRIAQEMGAKETWMDSPRPPYHLSTHDVGVHRMGYDPETSATDPFGAVHDIEGLYAVGGGSFVSYGGYNPTETIQALAYLSAEHLLERLGARSA